MSDIYDLMMAPTRERAPVVTVESNWLPYSVRAWSDMPAAVKIEVKGQFWTDWVDLPWPTP